LQWSSVQRQLLCKNNQKCSWCVNVSWDKVFWNFCVFCFTLIIRFLLIIFFVAKKPNLFVTATATKRFFAFFK
jgi:hypothetical protein